MKKRTLNFEIIVADHKKLFITYDLFNSGHRSLVTVEHNDLPVDVLALEVLHAEMYAEILAAMDNNAYSHNRADVFGILGDVLRPY